MKKILALTALAVCMTSVSYTPQAKAGGFAENLGLAGLRGAMNLARQEANSCFRRKKDAARGELNTAKGTAKTARDGCNSTARTTKETNIASINGNASLSAQAKKDQINAERGKEKDAKAACKNTYDTALNNAKEKMNTTLYGKPCERVNGRLKCPRGTLIVCTAEQEAVKAAKKAVDEWIRTH